MTEKLEQLLINGLFSDITFIVGASKVRVKAHKNILSVSNSKVFRSMLTGKSAKTREIRLPNLDASAFQSLLEYIYTDKFPKIDDTNWAPLIQVGDKYGISIFRTKCEAYVRKSCDVSNVCFYFSVAHKHSVMIPFLKTKIALNPMKTLVSQSFFHYIDDNQMLKDILSMDELDVDELYLFNVAYHWAKYKDDHAFRRDLRKVLGPALNAIRFHRMGRYLFMEEIVPKGILYEEEIINIVTSSVGMNPTCHRPRIRMCRRLHSIAWGPIRERRHSIQFRADERVKIHGYGVYRPHNHKVLEGRISLSCGNGILLDEATFEIGHQEQSQIAIISFKEAISIKANVWYVAKLEMNPLVSWMGFHGNSTETVEGVIWNFKESSLSKETNVKQGQLPIIHFSRYI